MAETVSAAEHYTISEIHETLDALDDGDWDKLNQLARSRCRFRFPGREQEVLNDALMRILEGKRKWPKGVIFAAFISGVMRSIVSKWIERSIVDPGASDDDPEIVCGRIGAFEDLHEKEVKVHLMALFDGDDEATLIVEGWFEDMEKKDFLPLFEGNETNYDTVCKRIRRKLAKHPELKEMIHGE
jgi:RNA polymerase sigma-70 factor (ECF subfamily)